MAKYKVQFHEKKILKMIFAKGVIPQRGNFPEKKILKMIFAKGVIPQSTKNLPGVPLRRPRAKVTLIYGISLNTVRKQHSGVFWYPNEHSAQTT